MWSWFQKKQSVVFLHQFLCWEYMGNQWVIVYVKEVSTGKKSHLELGDVVRISIDYNNLAQAFPNATRLPPSLKRALKQKLKNSFSKLV